MTALRFPWDGALPPAKPPRPSAPPKPRGRRPRATTPPASSWLYHHLAASGPSCQVAAFAEAARGSGVIPWMLDYAAIEEDLFNLAVSQPRHHRSLTVEGCRILARQFRHRVEARQARAAARVGISRACPLDLHTLLPIPAALLQSGPRDPTAQAWLRTNWGTADGLRQVAEHPPATARLPAAHSAVAYGFFTAGDTPAAAVSHFEACWPALRFSLEPRPQD